MMWRRLAATIPFPLFPGEKIDGPILTTDLGIIPPLALIIREYLDAATEIAWGREGERIFPQPRTYFLSDALDLAQKHAEEEDEKKLSSILATIADWARKADTSSTYAVGGEILPQFFVGVFHSTLLLKTADCCITVLNFLLSKTHHAHPGIKEVMKDIHETIRENVDEEMGEDWTDGICSEGCRGEGIDHKVFETNPLIECARYADRKLFTETLRGINLRWMKENDIKRAARAIMKAGEWYIQETDDSIRDIQEIYSGGGNTGVIAPILAEIDRLRGR